MPRATAAPVQVPAHGATVRALALALAGLRDLTFRARSRRLRRRLTRLLEEIVEATDSEPPTAFRSAEEAGLWLDGGPLPYSPVTGLSEG